MSTPIAPGNQPPITTPPLPSHLFHETTPTAADLTPLSGLPRADMPEPVPAALESSLESLTLDQLSLLHADVYRQNSHLDQKTSLIQNAKLLKTLLGQIPSGGELSSITGKLESLIAWGEQLEELQSGKDLNEAASAICWALKSLGKGDSITLPGGYAENALIYEISKTNDNKFDFQIINTGDGTQYHHTDSQGLKTKIAPLFTLTGITLEKLIGTEEKPKNDLFVNLLAFQSGGSDLGDVGAELVYAAIVGYFSEKLISKKPLSAGDFITPPRSESSSWKSLMALMCQTMSKDHYKKVVFLIKQNTLTSFFSKNEELLKADSIEGRQARELITLSAKKLSTRTSKIAHDGLSSLTPEEIKASQALIENILLTIDDYKKAIYAERSITIEPLDITQIVKPNIELTPWVPNIGSGSKTRTVFRAAEPLNFDANSFLDNLTISQKQFSTGYSGSLRLQRQLIIDFIKKAPKPWNDRSAVFYDKIPTKDIPQILTKLYHYFNAYIQLGNLHGFQTGIDKITLFSLYAHILEISLLLEERNKFADADNLSNMFGVDLDSPDLIGADNLMQSPYDRVEWESIRRYFKEFAPTRITHQNSYNLDVTKNPKPANEKECLLHYFHEFTKRHLKELTSIEPRKTHLDFTKDLFVGSNGSRNFNPRSGNYSELFNKIGFGHLPILTTCTLYLHHLFSGSKKTPSIEQGCFQRSEGDISFSSGRFYAEFETEKSYDWSHHDVIYSEGRYTISLHENTYWTEYSKVKRFKGPSESLIQRNLYDIGNSRIAAQSEAEAVLVDDPNLSTEEALKKLAEVKADVALDPRLQRHQILKAEGPTAIRDAEARLEATKAEMPYLIAHAATHNPLRPIELLGLASDNLEEFENPSIRIDFLQQFFKLPLHDYKFSEGAFNLIEDPNFERAFIEFLSKYKDSTVKFPVFTFGMKIGILLLPYVTKDSFKKAICTELEAIDLALTNRADAKELYSLHLLLALKEAFTFQKLFSSNPVSSASAGGPTSLDEITPDLQKCFNSLLRHWMWIKIKQEKAAELDDINQTIEDLIYPIFGLSITEKLIDDKALKEIVKEITNFDILTEKPSRPVKHNSIARMFEDENATCVDLFEGKITTKRDRISIVEFDQVYFIDSFKKVFGNKNDFKFSSTDSWYHFNDPMQGSFRVKTRPIFLLERLIGSDWARLHEDTQPQGMGNPEWAAIREFKTQIESHCQILTTDYFCYEGPKGYYYLLKGGDKTAYFIPRDPSLTIQKIDMESLEVISEITPISFLSEGFQKLISRFEDSSLVYLETKKSDGSVKLVFPRYKSSSKSGNSLTFILSGEDWLLESNQSKRLCKQFPDKLLNDFESFLVLETIATKKLSALIPLTDYQSDFPSFAGGAKLDFASSDLSMHTQSVSYDDIPFDGDLFQPATAEHKLRLFYLAAGQANFEIALSQLKKLSPSDLQTQSQRQIGKDCLKYLETKEQTPTSIALQMQLGYLLFYYEFIKGIHPQNKEEQENSALHKISSLYNRYCNRLGHIPISFRLSFEEERLLLAKISVLSSAMQARVSSCPELKPSNKGSSSLRSKSSPINLSVGLELLEYLPIPNDLRDLQELEKQAHDALHDLNSLKLMELVRTNPFIYDLVYDARGDESLKKQFNELLYLASCLTAKSTLPEYRLINKLLLMLNDSEGPPPLRTLYHSLTSLSRPLRQEKIDLWGSSTFSYLSNLNNPREFQLPQIDLEPTPSLYPHLEVLAPPNSRLYSEIAHQASAASQSSGSSSSIRLSATPKARFSWTGSAPESTALRALATLKVEINQNLISFNYGSICDRASIENLEETALSQSDPLLKGAFGSAFDSFIKGFDSIEEDERLIPALDTTQLETMEATLNEAIGETDSLVKAQLEEILILARAPSEDARLAQVSSGFLIGGVFKEVTIEQLHLLFLSSDKEAFQKACPQLSEEEIQTLYNKIGEHLYISIHLQQMNRLCEAAIALREELRSTSVKDALSIDGRMLRPEVISKALTLKMIAKQGIKAAPSPQHLLFQYTSHMFRTRPDQQRLIEELAKPSDKVAQVFMGGGKTTVFAANLLAEACAKGKIAIMITPNFQYEAVYKTIQGTLKRVFGIEVVTFQYTKEELNLDRLEALELTLLRVKHSAAHLEPKVLLLRPETLQFLTLEWLDTLNQIKGETSPSEDLKIKWKTLTNILKLLKEEGYSLGDEVHVLLDIVKEIHIPIGQLHIVEQENISLVRDIFKILHNIALPLTPTQKEALQQQLSLSEETPLDFSENADGNFTIKIDQFLKLRDNQQSYCSTKIYKDTILPAIATCLSLANSQSLRLDAKQQSSFCRYVQGDIKGNVQEALMTEEASGLSPLDRKDLEFLKYLSKLHNSSNAQEKKAADLIALSKYILSDLLPLLLSKTGNIHFGRKGDQKTPGEVVPYLCANTPSGNKFGNHYEAIIYHFMCALMFGAEDEQIRQLFSSWDKKARDLSKASLTYNETPPAALCKHLFGILPCQLDENGNFEAVKRSLKSDAPGFINRLFAIEENTVQTCVTYQKETISAHAHMLAGLCNQFQGLSGTFHLEELLLKLQENPELDVTVNPLCIRAFLEKPSKVLIGQEISPKGFIDENFAKLSGDEKAQLCALLDAGGVFKDSENKAVAKALLQKLKAEGRTDIKAVIFFTRLNGSVAADYPVLMRVNSDEVELLNGTSIEELSSKGLKAGDYAVYLDSHHCTGTDIPLPQNAVGFLTYDPSIGLDTTTQAMMRFRNYLINQSLVVVVPEYSCSLMPKTDKTLQEFVKDENHLEAKKILLAQMIIKQVELGSGKMIKAFRKMLEYTVFQQAKDLLLSTDDLEAIRKIASGFTSSLLHQTEDTPYLSFGSLSAQVDTVESLAKTSTKILAELRRNLETAKFTSNDIDTIIATIQKEFSIILVKAEEIKPQFISKVMELISGTPLGTEGTEREIAVTIERQNQVEREVRQEVQQEVEQEVQLEHKRLQLRKKQQPNKLASFSAADFLTQLSSENPVQGSIEPIKNLFDVSLQEYAPLFEDSPLLATTHFRQPYKSPTNLFDASHLKARPFQYLVICKLPNSSYRAVIVSGFEASKLVEHLRDKKSIDIWLTAPSARLQAGNQSSWEACCQNEQVKKMMVTFNLLGGNTEYLFKHVDQYCQWYFKQDQSPSRDGISTLKRFLKLIAVSHPLKKDQMLNYLIDPATLTNRLSHLEQLKRVLAFDDLRSFLSDQFTASLLSPLQLQSLRLEQVESIGKYLSPEQIRHIPGPFIKELPEDKLVHLSPSQVRYLTSKKQIQSLPLDLIGQLKKEDLDEGSQFLGYLTKEQYFSLTDPALIDQVPEAKLSSINPEMTRHIGTDPDRLRSLIVSGETSCSHFAHLSREQLEALGKEEDTAILFAQIPLAAIRTLNLTGSINEGTPQECNGFLSHLSPDQILQLTDEQIKQIKLGKDLVKLNVSKWIYGNEAAIRDIGISRIRELSSSDLTQELLDKFSEEQVHGLTTNQVLSLPDLNKCPLLSQEQLDLLPTSQYAQITSEILIKKIPDAKLRYIKLEMTPKIGTDARRLQCLSSIGEAVCLHFGYLDREQLEALSKVTDASIWFHQIPDLQIKDLDLTSTTNPGLEQECNGFISFLSRSQRAELTAIQVEKIQRGTDLAELNPRQWKHANTGAIQQLSPADIKKIPVEEVADEDAVSYVYEDEDDNDYEGEVLPKGELESLLRRLSTEQIQALTETQVKSLTDPNQCQYLSDTQVGWLTPEQYRKLTNEDLIKKIPEEKLVHIPIVETTKIGPNATRLRKLIVSDQQFCNHFGHLSREQLQALSKEEDAAALFNKIRPGDIKTLELTGQECSGFITLLNGIQRRNLTEKQIAQITNPEDLELLESTSWQHANRDSIQGLRLKKIQELPTKEITPLLLGKLSKVQVQALTEDQVQSLEDPNQCPYLTQTQVSLLTEAQYKKLTNKDLIQKVPDAKLGFIDPIMTPNIGPDASRLRNLILPGKQFCIHFRHLSREQLEALSKEASPATLFNKIPLDAIETLDLTGSSEGCDGFIAYLNEAQKEKLTAQQIGLINNPGDLERLKSAFWQHATKAALQALPLEKIQTIPSEEIRPLLLGKLSLEQVQALTEIQVQSLANPNQCLVLSQAQVGLLTDVQYQKLDNQWLIQKVPDDKLIHINPEMTKHIGLNYERLRRLGLDAPGKYAKHFAYLSRGQLDLLLARGNSRVHDLGATDQRENLADKISPDDISGLPLTETPCLIKHLSQEQISKLSPKQIEQIEYLEDLTRLPAHLWQHGRGSILRQLTPDLIQKIPSDGITDHLLSNLSQEQAENFTKKQISGMKNPNEGVRLPAAQLNWLPTSQLHKLSSENRAEIQRIMSVALERFSSPPELPEILTVKRDFRSIGSGFLPKDAQSTRDLWLQLERKTASSTSVRAEDASMSFYPFQASSEKDLERLWNDVFERPGSIIIDLTMKPSSDRFSYYPTKDTPWWYDPERGLTKASQRSKPPMMEDWEPSRLSCEEDCGSTDESDTQIEQIREELEGLESRDLPRFTENPRRKRLVTVEWAKTDQVANVVTYRILKDGCLSAPSKEDLMLQIASVNLRGRASFEVHAKEVQQYHYPKWPAHGIITIPNLHRLIENIENLTATMKAERTLLFELAEKEDSIALANIKPSFWVRGDEEAGSADTLMAALALKQKFDIGEIKKDNFDQAIEKIILALRKEKGPKFLQSKEQLDLLRRYANALLAKKPMIDSSSEVDPTQSELWGRLEEETRNINQIGWTIPKYIGDISWPTATEEIEPGKALTAHRVGKEISERYFVACNAPTESDQALFWKSILEIDGTSIVDLTEHDFVDLRDFGDVRKQDLPDDYLRTYYPKTVGTTIDCGDLRITCLEIAGIISTYQVTDTSAEPPITKTIKRCHYKKWPDGTAITLLQLQDLIKEVESLAPDPKKPLWVHCHMGVGRTGTLITALFLKEKILKGELNPKNLGENLVDIIASFRQERSTLFINAEAQLGLLYQYANHLMKTSPVNPSGTRSRPYRTVQLAPTSSPGGVSASTSVTRSNRTDDLASIQSGLWSDLEKETRKIDIAAWSMKGVLRELWPTHTEEIEPGAYLTAHRVGEATSERYFVACKAPTKSDRALFWKSILNGDETSIVDLTENDSYGGTDGVYYPKNKGEDITCESMIVTCIDIHEKLSTYEVTDTSIEPPITKIIRRYHYKTWPDYSAIPLPELQNLITEVECLALDPKKPLWIHCYYGVGRTGTLITALVLKEKIQKGELTRENLEKKLVDIIASFRKERALVFINAPAQIGLLYQYATYLLEGPSPSVSSGKLQDISSPAGVSAASTLPNGFVSERGAAGDCAPLSLLHQLQQRGITKPGGGDYTTQQEVRNIASSYLRANIDQLAIADITNNITQEALLMSTVVGSFREALADGVTLPVNIRSILYSNPNALLSFEQKKALLTSYTELVDKNGFWLDNGFFPFAAAALGRQIVILRPEAHPSSDVYISERFPEGATNPNEALFIYYNGKKAGGGNHYQSINLSYTEKLTSLIEKDVKEALTYFIKVMRDEKEKQDRIPAQTQAKAREHKTEIALSVQRNLNELLHRNPDAYKAIFTLLREGLGRAITLEPPLPDDVINKIFTLTEEEVRRKILSQST